MGDGQLNHDDITQSESTPKVYDVDPILPEQEDLKVSTYEDFEDYFNKASKDYAVRLQVSRLVVVLREPSLTNYILNGNDKNGIIKVVVGIERDSITGAPKMESLDDETLRQVTEFARNYFCNVVVSPKFSSNPNPNNKELDVKKVPINDLFDVLSMDLDNIVQIYNGRPIERSKEEVKEVEEKVASFREESQGNADRPSSEQVSQVTEPTFRNKE